MVEIRGVTWDLGGTRLYPFQAAQYLYKAQGAKAGVSSYPFRDAKRLMEACAIMGGESGWYVKAWHANVVRDDEGRIVRDALGKMTVKSVDLGWIQRNADVTDAALADNEVAPFVENLFDSNTYGYLDRPALAATEAANLYLARGWQPWYAYSNGGWRTHLPTAGLAVGNFLAVEYMNKQSFYTIRTR